MDHKVEKVLLSTFNSLLVDVRSILARVSRYRYVKMPVSSSLHLFEVSSLMRKIYAQTCDYSTNGSK